MAQKQGSSKRPKTSPCAMKRKGSTKKTGNAGGGSGPRMTDLQLMLLTHQGKGPLAKKTAPKKD